MKSVEINAGRLKGKAEEEKLSFSSSAGSGHSPLVEDSLHGFTLIKFGSSADIQYPFDMNSDGNLSEPTARTTNCQRVGVRRAMKPLARKGGVKSRGWAGLRDIADVAKRLDIGQRSVALGVCQHNQWK